MKARKWVLGGFGSLLLVCVVLVGLSALINSRLPAQSAVVDQLSAAEKAHLAEFFHLQEQLGAEAWPGWGSADIPVLVYNEAYAFLVGYPDPPAGWIEVPQEIAHGGPWELVAEDTLAGAAYYRQPLPASGQTPEAFTVKIGERWVASMTTREWMEISLRDQFAEQLPAFLEPVFPYPLVTNLFLRGSEGYISLVAHESFHAYQGEQVPERLAAAETAANQLADDYPWEDEAFQESWQTELDLLAAAVQAESARATADLAGQFLEQRERRREEAGLSPALADYERQREWLEGLARYVELAIWQQAAQSDTYAPVAAIEDDPDFSSYDTYARRWSQEVDQIGRMADDAGDGRFYYSGMAQAVLLERLMPDWENRILEEGVFLESLLAQSISENLEE